MNQTGETALTSAARDGQISMVTLLLDRGARIDMADKVNTLSVRSYLCCGGGALEIMVEKGKGKREKGKGKARMK